MRLSLAALKGSCMVRLDKNKPRNTTRDCSRACLQLLPSPDELASPAEASGPGGAVTSLAYLAAPAWILVQ